MSSNRILLDGQYARGVYVGRAVVSYPFLRNGDRSAIIVQRQFRVRESSYMPGQIGVERDPRYPIAYLAAESDPVPVGISDVIQVVRTLASVPADQVTYTTRVITKPDPVAMPGATARVYIIYNDSSLASFNLATRYLVYNWSSNGEVFTPVTTTTSANSGANTRVTWTAHGIVGTETILATITTSVYVKFAAGAYSVIDANTIDLLGVNYGTSTTECAEYYRQYVPGTDRVGIKSTQKFYLPGVTSGITTPQDIPLPTLLLNDAELLASAVANLTGYQTYDAGELSRWNDWPIYTQTLDQIDMATL